MVITPAKLASLVLSAIYVAIALFAGGLISAFSAGVRLLLPLAFIWYSEEIGSFTGGVGGGRAVDVESPEWLIAGIGWVILVTVVVGGIWVALK
jgi:hypothetical protein